MFLPSGVLKLALCAAIERTRYAMNGIAIERDEKGRTTLAATDGKRLVMAELDAPLSLPSELAEKYGIADDGKRIPLTVLPTLDTFAYKGGALVSKGIISLARDERKGATLALKGTLPPKPVRPAIPPKVKRVPLEKLPKMPKRSAFVALAGETAADTLARFKRERDTVASQRRTAKGLNEERRAENKRRAAERKATIAADREKYARALSEWRKARKEARRSRSVVALDLSKPHAPGIAFAPGRVRELAPVDGHFPPYRDVLPKPTRVNRFELIIDARALSLIVDSWNVCIAADERATSGAQADTSKRIECVRLSLEGLNATISGSVPGHRFTLSESQRAHADRWMRVIAGQGKCEIGFNPYFLSEMAESLHSAIGSSVAGDAFVRIGITEAHDAMLVAPSGIDATLGFSPELRGVRVSGVLMPVNLA